MFICEELQGPTILPIFLHPREIKETWVGAGRPEEELPDKVTTCCHSSPLDFSFTAVLH